MIEWRDEGVLLRVRHHGESAAIIDVFTASHGRQAGVVRGGASRRMAPILQPGAQVDVQWKARLETHLGSYVVEPIRARAAAIMGDRDALAALNAVTALLVYVMPEHEAHPGLYRLSVRFLDLLAEGGDWAYSYLLWELALLEEMGFGLDLETCAVTGTTEDLVFVSPRSGRAVSRGGAGEWADRLLPLPPALKGVETSDRAELGEGFRTTGYFLSERMAKELVGKPLPAARDRLVERLVR